MITPAIGNAIVKVMSDDGARLLGTGFLVDQEGGLILTAGHVADLANPYQVVFPPAFAVPASLARRGAKDWALLRCKPDGLPLPVPLGDFRAVTGEVTWRTLGHASIQRGFRGAYHGVVRELAATLDLFCAELANKKYDDARGLSGAPCIVDGVAVALITDVMRANDTDEIITGTVDSLPLHAIVADEAAQLRLADQLRRLPWQELFLGRLQGLQPADLLIAAAAARLAKAIAAPAPEQIARRMINQGVLAISAVMQQLLIDADTKDRMMTAAESLWVDAIAADELARVVRARGAGVICTNNDTPARQALHCAFGSSEVGTVPWKSTVVEAPHQEPYPEAVLSRAFEELRELLRADDDETVKRRVKNQGPVAVLIPAEPRADVVEKLKGELPELVVLFFTRMRPVAGDPPDVKRIEPEQTEAMEKEAQNNNADARDAAGVPRAKKEQQ